MFTRLRDELERQVKPFNDLFPMVEILSWDKEGMSIGAKRNALLSWAKGDYVSFIDDDDRVHGKYVRWIMEELDKKPDVVELFGEITTNGENPKLFHHSVKHKKYEEKDGVYLRYPNHLNVIKSEIAKQFRFPEINHGEDTDWATQVFKSGLLQLEAPLEQIVYYYDYRTKNKNG